MGPFSRASQPNISSPAETAGDESSLRSSELAHASIHHLLLHIVPREVPVLRLGGDSDTCLASLTAAVAGLESRLTVSVMSLSPSYAERNRCNRADAQDFGAQAGHD